MNSRNRNLRSFGRFSLDTEKRILWCEGRPVNLALKEIELLCVLTENSGEVVTKAELLDLLWADSFVEESNLSRHVYVLRKMFKSYGAGNPIETVPRRGYRFADEVRQPAAVRDEFTIERHAVSMTTIEEVSNGPAPVVGSSVRRTMSVTARAVAGALLVVTLVVGFATWREQLRALSESPAEVRSLAILPFLQIDQDPEAKQLGIGLADLLITRLSNLKGITVRPITAVIDVDNRDPVSAGKLLGVDAVLVGTIYRSGDQTRVNARMIKISDGNTIWTGEFERSISEGLRLQSDLALRLTHALVHNLDDSEKSALAKAYTNNSEAFHLYQRGRFEWNKRNAQGATDAVSLFRLAVETDPEFALAYVGLAEVVATTNPGEAEVIARKAIELDPDLAEAHAALGFIQTFVHRNWAEAEKELARSVDLNPNYAPAHHWYAELLAILGRNADAKIAMHRAVEINPLSHNFLADLGQIYYFNREYKEAEHYCRRALELKPDFLFAHQYLADIYLQTGDFERAVDAELTAELINGRSSINSAAQAKEDIAEIEASRMLASQHGKREFLKRLISKSGDKVFQYYDARRYAALGEKEMTLHLLEKSVDDGAFHTAFVKVDPIFDPVREDARYKLVLQKMNLLDGSN